MALYFTEGILLEKIRHGILSPLLFFADKLHTLRAFY